jgi:DNA-binding Lrp family transcriptional regulator
MEENEKMEVGYVVFNLTPGLKKEFVLRARKIGAVKEARLVLGNWDAIAIIHAKDVEDMERVYFNEVDKIPGVTASRLYIRACPRTRK